MRKLFSKRFIKYLSIVFRAHFFWDMQYRYSICATFCLLYKILNFPLQTYTTLNPWPSLHNLNYSAILPPFCHLTFMLLSSATTGHYSMKSFAVLQITIALCLSWLASFIVLLNILLSVLIFVCLFVFLFLFCFLVFGLFLIYCFYNIGLTLASWLNV